MSRHVFNYFEMHNPITGEPIPGKTKDLKPEDFKGKLTAADIDIDEVFDAGDGHTYEFIYANANNFPTVHPLLQIGDGRVIVGFLWSHDVLFGEPGQRCQGEIPLVAEKGDKKPYVWSVGSLVPLTVMPSLNCGTCPSHGWMRNGKFDEIVKVPLKRPFDKDSVKEANIQIERARIVPMPTD